MWKKKKNKKKKMKMINSSFPTVALPYEHLIHDITEFLKQNNLILDPIEKKNMKLIIMRIKENQEIYLN